MVREHLPQTQPNQEQNYPPLKSGASVGISYAVRLAQSCDNQLEWFWLTDGEYLLLSPDPDGIVRSLMFRGYG